jgi:hypothetical protein
VPTVNLQVLTGKSRPLSNKSSKTSQPEFRPKLPAQSPGLAPKKPQTAASARRLKAELKKAYHHRPLAFCHVQIFFKLPQSNERLPTQPRRRDTLSSTGSKSAFAGKGKTKWGTKCRRLEGNEGVKYELSRSRQRHGLAGSQSPRIEPRIGSHQALNL